MNKVRVYEVARELGLPNQEVVQRIATLGIQVRNHMSSLDAGEADRIRRALAKGQSSQVVEERIRPTVVRRRAAAPDIANAEKAVAFESVQAPTVSKTEPRQEANGAAAQQRHEALEARHAPPENSAAPAPGGSEDLAAPGGEVGFAEPQRPYDAGIYDSGEPAPASVRFAHANLPPGVVARGDKVSAGAAPLSASARSRIVSEHAARWPEAPRRRELGRAALGPAGRPQTRLGKKRMVPGKKGKQTEITVPSAQKRVVRIEDQVQLQGLAQRMSLKATDVLMKLMQLGMSGVHINSTLDADTAKILANEFGWEVENVARSNEEIVETARGEFLDVETDRQTRAPIVTVMGHVDHGKTSLLDKIRSANVARGEAGGITQHIGAYRVETESGPVVFLDTPGHEAFTAMRARGAQTTDVVVLVVAADDGVMPQTREAIAHAKAAKVPIIVALNKIDKPDARPEQIKTALASEGLQPEEWGGDTMFVPCSAVSGEGIDKLLECLSLQSEVLELRANPTIPAEGVILEAYLDRGRGPVANVLVRNGTLKPGDILMAGAVWGRVRALNDDRGKPLKIAGPATPLEILGLSEMPVAGDPFYVVTDQRRAQEVTEARRKAMPVKPGAQGRSLEQVYQMMQGGDSQELRLVIKADVQGSVEAVQKALTDLSTDKVKVSVIHSGVGGINENDVMLASASNAILLGFNVRPAGQAGAAAKAENVDIRTYSIIYEAIDEVRKAMAGLLSPRLVEKELGKAEVRQVFQIPKIGSIAGSFVTEGKLLRGCKARLLRDSLQVWQGSVESLRRFKDDAKEVTAGYECGIRLAGYSDMKEGDIVEAFEVEQVAATLD